MSAKPRPQVETLGVLTTGAYNSAEISIQSDVEKVSLSVSKGSTPSHIVQINQSTTNVDADDDWETFFLDGVEQKITLTAGAENSSVLLDRPGTYRVAKAITTVAGQVIAKRLNKVPLPPRR